MKAKSVKKKKKKSRKMRIIGITKKKDLTTDVKWSFRTCRMDDVTTVLLLGRNFPIINANFL